MIRKLLVASFVGITMMSCLKDKTIEPVVIVGPCADTVSFSSEILGEVINISCNTAGCHNATDATAGYVFETHTQIDDNAVLILKVIRHEGLVQMPAGGPKLADSLIQKFDCWIEQGKQDN